jgi:hypothetical protein
MYKEEAMTFRMRGWRFRTVPFNVTEIQGSFFVTQRMHSLLTKYEMSRMRKSDSNVLTHNELHTTGGKIMKMKFKEYDVVDQPGKGGKSWKMCAVKGDQIGGKSDGLEVTKKFFCSEKDMYSTVKELSAGDTIEIGMKQNGKWWNVVSIDKIDRAESAAEDAVKSHFEKSTSKASVASHSIFTDEELRRKENLSLAAHIVKASGWESLTETTDIGEIFDLAERIEGYLKNGIEGTDQELPDDDFAINEEDN